MICDQLHRTSYFEPFVWYTSHNSCIEKYEGRKKRLIPLKKKGKVWWNMPAT